MRLALAGTWVFALVTSTRDFTGTVAQCPQSTAPLQAHLFGVEEVWMGLSRVVSSRKKHPGLAALP
jgi:hypothetical protein